MDALLKAFWFRPSLRFFLQQHGIAEKTLACWHPDQSKRQYIEWLWPRLVRDDRGNQAILAMARSLAEMNDFPDLERREDTVIRVPEAKLAAGRLREPVQKVDAALGESEQAQQRRQAAQQSRVQVASTQPSIGKLQKELDGLIPDLGTQEAGYAFEKWFYDLAVFYELYARPGYKTGGRQIDGAVTIESTTYLVETRFTREPIGSPDIDVFMAKIESKADNTMGLFVSIAGFNEGAVQAASKAKTPMLLLDHSHLMNLILRGVMTLPDVVARVKRHASQTGSAFLPASEF